MSAVTAPSAASTNGQLDPRVVVTVGTDHHPFDRLIGWINDWLRQHPEQAGTFFVQSGTASVPPACAGEPFLDIDQLDVLLDGADVVVCHGGPGSIADAWNRGQLPIVVPRLRRHGEVVDDHQVDFCVKLAELGRVRLAWTADALAGFLDESMRGGPQGRASVPAPDIDSAVARLAELVDELVSRPRRRLWLPHRAGRGRPEKCTDDVTEQPAISRARHSPSRAGVPREEQE